MTSPYEDLLIKMLEEKKHRLRWLEDSSGSKKEIRLLKQEISDLETRLNTYNVGVGYFRRKNSSPAAH